MQASGAKSLQGIGFLTVVQHQHDGLFGGYLVLNAKARPLEFHCTAPVKPNRAQEILYGPTLTPYLFGEQIGQTLVTKSKVAADIIFTDTAPALTLREFVNVPVVLVVSDEIPAKVAAENRASRRLQIDGEPPPAASAAASSLAYFSLGPHQVAVENIRQQDVSQIAQMWQPIAEAFDLNEPFERIHEAIAEAHGSRQAA